MNEYDLLFTKQPKTNPNDRGRMLSPAVQGVLQRIKIILLISIKNNGKHRIAYIQKQNKK